ncbi:hypothetical protein ACGFX4_04135 [Kitasatospora sp. NPDC048365]|uniref:hypothetical protein n=1 Tax=Kitasatospora sp. NPDC048365 TaxID=3364050 RepID=UPI0037189EE0
MSYCAPCRRYLNGALSCPGCGARATVGPVPGAPHAAQAPHPPEASTALLPAVRPAGSLAQTPGTAPDRRRRPSGRAGRRIAVLTAAGLVLGGAGVLAAANTDAGADPAQPAPTSQPDRLPQPSVSTALPLPSSAKPSAGTAKPSRSASSSAKPSASATPSSAAPTTAAPTTAAPPTQATTPPSPKPSPSPTCTPVLFWCR